MKVRDEILQEALAKIKEMDVKERFYLEDIMDRVFLAQLTQVQRYNLENGFLKYAVQKGVDIIPVGRSIFSRQLKYKKMS